MAMRAATMPVLTRPRYRPTRVPAQTTPRMTPIGMFGITIAGTTVHLTDSIGAREAVEEAVHARNLPPLAVASINLDHIHHLPTLHGETEEHGMRWLNLVDGAPIASQIQRMTGAPCPRLAGSDLIRGILDDAAANGSSVAVLGGSPEVSSALAERFATDWPSVRFAGHWTPAREEVSSPESSLAVAAQIRASGADIVIVCLGKPRQEIWIDRYGQETGAGVLLAFGAVVDFLAGRVSRAPRWVSDAGFEWMWRLMLEPRRLARRYLVEGPPAYLAVRRSSLPHRA